MDYLPRPKDPAIAPVKVKFEEPEKYWHDGTWKEHSECSYWDSFPKRHGYQEDKIWNSGTYSNKAWAHADFHQWIMARDTEDLRNIAIGWLFFGTLAAVTRCSLDIADYLQKTDDGKQCVKLTEAMMDILLQRWHIVVTHFEGSRHVRGASGFDAGQAFTVDPSTLAENKDGIQQKLHWLSNEYILSLEAKLDSEGKSKPFEQAHQCLERSKAIIGLICQAIDAETVYAIATLHEFLATALTRLVFKGEVANAYGMDGRWSLGSWILGADFTYHNRLMMQKLGWCPRTSSDYWARSSRSLATDYFSVSLPTHQTSEDHSNCSEDLCVAYQLDSSQYKVAHTDSCSSPDSCVFLELDPIIASAVLESEPESFPLLTLSTVNDEDEDSAFIEVRDSTCTDEYIAVSHVWSHGMGNPQQNALPRCRLRYLQELVDDVGAQVGVKDGPVPFWMDTLCCPTQPKASRRAAIMKMDSVYKGAELVLVVDRNLTSTSLDGISKLEKLMQVYRTTWMKRLWTLQEARLARQIWFQFNEKALNLELLDKEFSDDPSGGLTDLLLRHQFAGLLSACLKGLRDPTQKGSEFLSDRDGEYSEPFIRMLSLTNGLRGRSTSWASDEAICICNLTGLNLKPVLNISIDEPSCAALRMAAVWKQWTDIPQSMIFNRAPRLLEKGYRWAPATFVRTKYSGFPLIDMDRVGKVDSGGEGLVVTVSGFMLRSKDIPLLVAEERIALQRQTDSRWRIEAGTGDLESYPTFLINDPSSFMHDSAPGSIKWYDVQVGNPVHEPMPDFDRDGELAIIFSNDVNMANVDLRQKPGLLVSMRKFERGIMYTTSLYHVLISRSESVAEKLFTAAIQVQGVAQDIPGLSGQFRDGRVRPGPAWDDTNQSQLMARQMIRAVVQSVLDDPEVKAYIQATFMRNRDSSYATWMNASEAQRENWDFRADHGDVRVFFEMIVNVWLNFSVIAMPLVNGLRTFCVD